MRGIFHRRRGSNKGSRTFQGDALTSIEYGFTIRAVSALTRSTFGVFAIPVAVALLGEGGDIAIAYGLFSLTSGLSAPVLGLLMDRFGLRRIQRVGALLMIAGLLLSSTAIEPWHYIVGMGVMCGLGATAFTQIPVNLLIARFVHVRRLPAFGIVTAGAGVGALVAVPLTERVISGWGWRPAYLAYAVVVILVWIPFDLWLGSAGRRTPPPRDTGMVTSVESEEPEASATPTRHRWQPYRGRRLTIGEFQLVTAGFFSGAQRTLVVAFIVPWLIDRGYDSLVAAQAFGLSEGLRAFSGVTVSMVGNRFGAKATYLAATAIACLSIAGLLLFADGNTALLYLTSSAYGMASGGIHPASSSLQSLVYSPERLGVLFGASAASYGLGGALSVVAASWVRRSLGGIDAVIALIAVGLFMMGALVFGVAKPGSEN